MKKGQKYKGKKGLGVLCMLGIAILSLNGCSGKNSIVDSFKDGWNAGIQQETQPSTVFSADNMFYINVPSGWKQSPKGELNDNAEIEVDNRNEEMYCMVMKDGKEGLDINLDEYADIISEQTGTSYNEDIGEPEDTTVGKYPAKMFEFNFVIEGEKIAMWMYCVETKYCFVQLYSWTLQSSAEEYKEELQDVVNSFSVSIE